MERTHSRGCVDTWSSEYLLCRLFHFAKLTFLGSVMSLSCVPLLVPPDDRAFLKTAAAIYAKHERYPEALALAIRLRDKKLIRKYFEGPSNM